MTVFAIGGNNLDRQICGWLAIVEGPGRGKAFRIYEGKNIIGGNLDCDIVVESLEPHHFSIRCEGGIVIITDLDSDSGTHINGERILRKEVENDEIKITARDIVFVLKKI